MGWAGRIGGGPGGGAVTRYDNKNDISLAYLRGPRQATAPGQSTGVALDATPEGAKEGMLGLPGFLPCLFTFVSSC